MTTTSVAPSSTTPATTSPARLRSAAWFFLAAGILNIVGLIVEYGSNQWTVADGPLYVVHQAIFWGAELALIVGSLGFARTDSLAARTRAGRVFLRIFAITWAVIIVSGILVNFLGIDVAVIGLAAGGYVFTLSALGAGIALAVRPAPGGWARWSMFCYGVYSVLLIVVTGLLPTAQGPAFGVELGAYVVMALVGVSVLVAREARTPSTI